MDWGMVGVVSGVVTFVVGGAVTIATAWLNTQIENKILRSEDSMIRRINGAYVRTDMFEQYAEGIKESAVRLDRRYEKVVTDMGHMQESIGRLTARIPMPD